MPLRPLSDSLAVALALCVTLGWGPLQGQAAAEKDRAASLRSGRRPSRQRASGPLTQADAQAAGRLAQAFFQGLLAQDTDGVASLLSFPFYLEDKKILHADELSYAWWSALTSKRLDLLSLGEISLLTPRQMQQAYGKAPERLADWSLKGGAFYFAVADLGSFKAVALLKREGEQWKVAAYHD